MKIQIDCRWKYMHASFLLSFFLLNSQLDWGESLDRRLHRKFDQYTEKTIFPFLCPLNPLNTIVLWCTGGFRGALNWAILMPRDASLSDSYLILSVAVFLSTMRKLYLHFISYRIGFNHGQFSSRFWTKWNFIRFKIERKTLTMSISHSMSEELEVQFSQCSGEQIKNWIGFVQLHREKWISEPFQT